MKRVLKSMGWTLLGNVALVVDVVAVLHVPEGQEFIRFMVERKVAENFRGDVNSEVSMWIFRALLDWETYDSSLVRMNSFILSAYVSSSMVRQARPYHCLD